VSARIAQLSPTDQVIAKALQQYGAFIADNGSSGFITGVPDARWSDDDLGNLKAHATVTVTLATSADASSGSKLTFAGAASVRAGMWVQCHSACSGIGVAGSTVANPVVNGGLREHCHAESAAAGRRSEGYPDRFCRPQSRLQRRPRLLPGRFRLRR